MAWGPQSQVTDVDQKHWEEIREWNSKLGQTLNELKFSLNNAISNGIFGSDDPVTHSFAETISEFEIDVEDYRASYSQYAEVEKPKSTFSSLWSSICRMVGHGANLDLEREIEAREESFRDARQLYTELIKTTKSSQHYSNIKKVLPQDGKRLAMLDDGSATKLLRYIGKMTPSVDKKAKYMKLSFATSIGLLEKGIVQTAFDSMDQEVKFILNMRTVKTDAKIRGIVQSVFQMSRTLVIIFNMHYAWRRDDSRAYVEFAQDRFKACYMLIQNISVTLQDLKETQEPIGLLLLLTDPFPSSPPGTIYTRYQQPDTAFPNMNTLAMHLPPGPDANRQRTSFFREMEGQDVFHSSCDKFHSLLRHCLKFVQGTDALMKAALSVSLETAHDTINPSDRSPPSHSEDNYSRLSALDSRLRELGLFSDDRDTDYVPNPPVVWSEKASNITNEDVINKMKELDLFEMKNSKCRRELIDKGSHGEIYRVPYEHAEMLAALKLFKKDDDEHKSHKRAIREAIIMSDMDHENVLRAYGYDNSPSTGGKLDVSLVLPFHLNGSLNNYLYKRRLVQPVSELSKLKILLDIARALKYLHDPEKKGGLVIHGDLRAMNVLIGPDEKALVCDFGMALRPDIDEAYQTNSNQTNDAWLAYEFFGDDDTGGQKVVSLTTKTDVYAFGCVCYEVLQEKTPYHGCPSRIVAIRKSKYIEPTIDFPQEYLLESGYRQLMKRCWHAEPARRPSASQLVQYLEQFVSFLSISNS